MKKSFRPIFPVAMMCAACVISILAGIIYYNFISHRIYNDSTANLEEIYGQVNDSFSAFVDRNWGLLDGWGDYLALAGDSGSDKVAEFISSKQTYWGFSEFYFISRSGSCMTPDGVEHDMDLTNVWTDLMEKKEPIMSGETLSASRDVTVFAAPVSHGEYRGFGFDAIAISYTNADLADSLSVSVFSGNAKCFVLHSDGTVLLSTQTGGNIFENYLVYLKASSDLNSDQLKRIENDLAGGSTDLLQCKIGGVDQYILYQPIGYQDYMLFSVVPQSAVSSGFLSIQRATLITLLIIFVAIGTAVIVPLIMRSSKKSRQSRLELQYRERMFDVLSNSVDDIFLMLNTEDLGVEYVSPNVERLLGIKAEEIRKDIRVMAKCAVDFDVVIPQDVLESIPLNGNKHWECEYMHQQTGERRWYRMTAYRMSIQNVIKYIIVLSDRTQEREMNKKLQEALTVAKNANEAKSNFLSNMSHDIRTPMNAIVGFSVLLEKDADQPEKVREYTHKIKASSHHLLSLINDVLDMSKIESGKTSLNMDVFSLPELLEDLNIILMPQAKAKEQSFEIHVQGAPPEQIIGDKLRLNQILINVLSNAIKYTPEGGRIDFTVSELPQSGQQLTKLRFVVSDNGIGMSREFQKNIFAPFSREISSVTNTIQGTGLGMAITKNLVDLMGGIIKVKSSPGRGSTFTVELSFALPESKDPAPWFRKNISRMLVADDEEEICLDIKEMMRDTDVEVSYVTDGARAVEMAAEADEKGQGFDVILLDWKMPGLNGVETARMIRSRIGHDIPILVLTSYDWSEIENEARQAGINAFMPKPFFTSTFWQTIEPLFFDDAAADAAAPSVDAGGEGSGAGAGSGDGEASKGSESSLSGMHFLVAEDNELNAEILTEMLDMEGADCELAVNGKAALDMFTGSEPGRYDMILMDVQMPVMNGYEATRAIRSSSHQEARTIPIVAMTANTFAEDVRDALDSGMNGHLAKPIDMNTVREVISRLMNEKKTRDKEGNL